MLSDSFGFGLGALTGLGFLNVGSFRLRKRRFVDANYVSIKDVAAYCNTTKSPYGSRTNTSWMRLATVLDIPCSSQPCQTIPNVHLPTGKVLA